MTFYQKNFYMKLFERIRFFSKSQKIPLVRIAEHIGVSPQTFSTWFAEKSQRNLWEHLQKILDLYPELSRDWLYFGEGSMLKTDTPKAQAPNQPPAYADNSALLELLNKNRELEEKVFELKERLADKEKLIALLEENKRLAESVSAVVTPTEARRDNPQHATSVRPVTGVPGGGI